MPNLKTLHFFFPVQKSAFKYFKSNNNKIMFVTIKKVYIEL